MTIIPPELIQIVHNAPPPFWPTVLKGFFICLATYIGYVVWRGWRDY